MSLCLGDLGELFLNLIVLSSGVAVDRPLGHGEVIFISLSFLDIKNIFLVFVSSSNIFEFCLVIGPN